MTTLSAGIISKVKSILTTRYFLVFIIAVTCLQGLWYALNFRPSILDEGRHIGMIEVYTDQWSPFIANQDPKNDALGDTTRDPSYFYYYMLSIPDRVVNLVYSSERFTVTFLRIIHIAVFALGIYMYDKFFRRIGASTAISRLALLFLVLTPAVAVLPGVVNYDNFVFLFSGLLLLQAASLIGEKHIKLNQVLLFLCTVLFGSLIKYTFLALAFPVTVYVLYVVAKSRKVSVFKLDGYRNFTTMALLILSVVGLILFIERPVSNYIQYSSFSGDCIALHGEERCSENYVQRRNTNALDRKPSDFTPVNLYEYTFIDWIPNMVLTQVRLNPWDAPSKVLHALYFLSLFTGVFFILVYLRNLLTNKNFVLMLFSILVFSSILLLTNYKIYQDLGEVVATSSRYLLPVQPLFMVTAMICTYWLVRKYKKIQILILCFVLACFVFGGGVLTYNAAAPAELRWNYKEN